MNKRQYKKYVKKYKRKSYIDVRYETIYDVCNKKCPNTNPNCRNIIYIEDSKRMDFKHPVKILLFENSYPISIGHNYIPGEKVEYSFNIKGHNVTIIDRIAEEWARQDEMYKSINK